MTHPYKSMPDRSFWKRAVAADWDATDVADDRVLIGREDIVASAGSCFAANIVPTLEAAGLTYARTRETSAMFGDLATDNFGYSTFSAAYGNVYTARQAFQLLQRAMGIFKPVENRWIAGNSVIDPFRPGLRYPASSETEFDLLQQQHFRNVLDAFRMATVFVFTLGMTEAWVSKKDGAVFPACPGTIAGTFDPDLHGFENFRAPEVSDDIVAFIELARQINPSLRFILTVSPVPLVATASGKHVLAATIYSKSVLRVATEEATMRLSGVEYFPAYEIVTGPQAPAHYFEADRREPSRAAIDAVMAALLARCETTKQGSGEDAFTVIVRRNQSKADDARDRTITSQSLSAMIAEADCEEAAAGL